MYSGVVYILLQNTAVLMLFHGTGPHGNLLHAAVRTGNYEIVQLVLALPNLDCLKRSEVTESTAIFDAVRCVRLSLERRLRLSMFVSLF